MTQEEQDKQENLELEEQLSQNSPYTKENFDQLLMKVEDFRSALKDARQLIETGEARHKAVGWDISRLREKYQELRNRVYQKFEELNV